MAKNAVTDWSTTAASNTDIGGIGIQGSNVISNVDNALRELMAQIATFNSAPSFGATGTFTSTDAGASAGPVVDIYRNSASPANNDVLGQISFSGRNITGADKQTYAEIYAVAQDYFSLSLDANVVFRTRAAGVMTTQATITSTGWNGMNIGATTPGSGAFTTLTSTSAPTFNSTNTNGVTVVSTDAGATVGPILLLDRNSASPAANDQMGYIHVRGRNDAAANRTYFDIITTATSVTAGAEESNAIFRVMTAGVITTRLTLTGTGINATPIGVTTRSTGAFTTLGANSTVTFTAGGSMTGTWSDLGSVTTIDINGGTVDGAAIGASSASTGRFTTCTATTTFNLPVYTVAGLPAAGTAGRMAYCSNVRVFNGAGVQEGAGAGTGGLVTDNGTAWKIAGTNVTAIA